MLICDTMETVMSAEVLNNPYCPCYKQVWILKFKSLIINPKIIQFLSMKISHI